MNLTSTTPKDKNVVELEIAVGAKELEEAAAKVFKRKGKTITIPGFRKGKATRGMIEKMYGEGVFLEDAVNDLYPAAYEEAVEQAGIDPVDRADVEILTLDKETGFTFRATVTVKPEVSVKDYKGISAEKVIGEVSDEDVDKEIEQLRERNARSITIEDRPAQNGDATVIDFEGFVDGVAFDGGKGDGYQLTLGSGQFIPGFEEQIVGHTLGEEFDVNVTFPEEYHSDELAGKASVFKVKLHEIKGKELPELDDEFAKDVSEFDTLAEFKDDVRKKLQENSDRKAQEDFETKLVDQVIENLESDIPECMFENKIDELVRDFEYRLSSQGMNMQLYLQYTGMEMDSFRKSFREQAERQVKIRLALEKIAELEGLEASDEEVEKELEKMAEAYKTDIERLRTMIPVKDVKHDIKAQKAIDLIRDSAKVTEVAKKAEEKKPAPKKKAPAKTKKAEPNDAE